MTESIPAPLKRVWLQELEEVFPGDLLAHPMRVGEIAARICEEYCNKADEAPGFQCGDLQVASTMHDIGKRVIEAEILTKRVDLTDGEMSRMRFHTVAGAEWLKQTGDQPVVDLAATIALRHHEWWDGSGYPGAPENVADGIVKPGGGLSGEEIPLAARITSVADVYDALRRERSYKRAWSHEEAVTFISDGAGTQFDPQIVELFLGLAASFA